MASTSRLCEQQTAFTDTFYFSKLRGIVKYEKSQSLILAVSNTNVGRAKLSCDHSGDHGPILFIYELGWARVYRNGWV
jgi:hypothetical protein